MPSSRALRSQRQRGVLEALAREQLALVELNHAIWRHRGDAAASQDVLQTRGIKSRRKAVEHSLPATARAA